ncbi:MAG: BON domain-containing protein [Candidatus Dormibacteraceae bacterium]
MGLLKFQKRGQKAANKLAKASAKGQATLRDLPDIFRELPIEIDKKKLAEQSKALREQGKILREQGTNLANDLRQAAARKLAGLPGSEQIQPKRRFTLGRVVLGSTALAAAVGAAWLVWDRDRRERVRLGLSKVRNTARHQYVQLGGVGGAVESARRWLRGVSPQDVAFQDRVLQAVAPDGEIPEGLRIEVEGRTVYLKGEVKDPATIDLAATRAHSADGVVAVINHATLA